VISACTYRGVQQVRETFLINVLGGGDANNTFTRNRNSKTVMPSIGGSIDMTQIRNKIPRANPS